MIKNEITGKIEFTPEQLNQLLSNVIKDTLNTAAENIEADLEPLNWLAEKHLDSPLIAGEDYEIGVSRSAIKNLFEKIFKKFQV